MKYENFNPIFRLGLLRAFKQFQRQNYCVTKWDNEHFQIACQRASEGWELLACVNLDAVGDPNVVTEMLVKAPADQVHLWNVAKKFI